MTRGGGIRMNSRYVSWNVWTISTVLVRVHTLSEGRARRFRQYQHCINPAVGALYHHVTHLLVCDSPDGQQHVCFAKLVALQAWHDTLTRYITVAHCSKSPSAR
ncbi:cellulose synthesis regulatory protein (signal transduction protein) [Escherichia coli]|nr:cellulose synthesis regulatory protein (signal transduction protein) [Escherichia coli]